MFDDGESVPVKLGQGFLHRVGKCLRSLMWVFAALILSAPFSTLAYENEEQRVNLSADEEARFALHGRPAPENYSELKAKESDRKRVKKAANVKSAGVKGSSSRV